MTNHEDSDMKIFGSAKKDESADFVALAEEAMRHRFNGNVPKAKELGARLADFAPDNSLLGDKLAQMTSGNAVTLDLKVQIKVLLVFTIEYTLYKQLPEILAAAASDSMYDRLRDESEGFYSNICDGGAFTFYYLAVRGDSSIEEAIGESFAMLCDSETNPAIRKLGTNVFKLACNRISDMIAETKFQ